MDRYMAEKPEEFLEYCDWMGIPMQAFRSADHALEWLQENGHASGNGNGNGNGSDENEIPGFEGINVDPEALEAAIKAEQEQKAETPDDPGSIPM